MNQSSLKIFTDFCCLILFSIPVFVYNFTDIVPVTELGFFCNDLSIRYPYHNSSVSSTLNTVLAFVTMFLMAVSVEFYIFLSTKKTKKTRKQKCHPVLSELYRALGYFVIGAAINRFVTDFCKLAVGRLRPHFFDVCLPNVTCSDENQFIYFENFICSRESHPLIPTHRFEKALLESRKSFPSGHASVAIYAYLYMCIYLEFRLRSDNLIRLFRHVFQLAAVVWSLWVCCSRVYDFKHHPTDVLAGMAVGTFFAVFTAYLYIWSYTRSHKLLQSERKTNFRMNSSGESPGHHRPAEESENTLLPRQPANMAC